MILKSVILGTVLALTYADKDDKKWVWDQNSRNTNERSFIRDPNRYDNRRPRYEVVENEYRPIRPDFYPDRPDFNEKPLFQPNKPFVDRPVGFIPNQRPGGLYGQGNLGNYGQGQSSYYPEENNPGILTGPVPSWVKESPYKNYDKCKCTEKFNCNSPGISYGHCDVGKQYCCYVSKKSEQAGSPIPTKNVYSPENGVLVGPGGPVDPLPGVSSYPKPPVRETGFPRPGYQTPGGNYLRPGGGFGVGGRPGSFEPNGFAPENGILVGPGGPFDRPYNRGGNSYGLSRSNKKE